MGSERSQLKNLILYLAAKENSYIFERKDFQTDFLLLQLAPLILERIVETAPTVMSSEWNSV